MPRSPQQARILRDHVKASLSFPYSDYDGTRGKFSLDNPLDSLVSGIFGELSFKLQSGTKPAEKSGFNTSLKRLLDLMDEQPERSLELVRPLQRIRQDFEWALLARDFEASKRYLDELTTNGRLSQENTWYLQIQRWASLGIWEKIIEHPDLEDLLCLRRPSKVTYAILRAFREVYLVNDAIDRDSLKMLLTKEPLAGLAGIRLIIDAHLPTDVSKVYEEIQDLLGRNTATKRNIDENSIDSPSTKLEGLQLAESLWVEGEFAHAMEVLDGCPNEIRKLILILRICREVPTPDLVGKAVSARDAASIEDLVLLNEMKEGSELLAWLSGQIVGKVLPGSLAEWLDTFKTDESDFLLEGIFNDHADSWNCIEITPQEAESISDRMESILDSERSSLLIRMLPGIHNLVADSSTGVKIPVLQTCFLALALQDQPTNAELVAMHHVVDVLLDHLGGSDRSEILQEILGIWLRIANSRRLLWMLDMVATIKATAGPHDAEAEDVILRMAAVVASFLPGSVEGSLEKFAAVILVGIYDVKDWSDIWQISRHEAETEESPFATLEGKSVGIYCLETTRTQRMAAALNELCKCNVTINSDYVGTSQLTALASNADLMVVITSAAKHAATGCIQDNRKNAPTAFIHSTGVSTFLRAIAEFLAVNQI
jgi:hypothetical protein